MFTQMYVPTICFVLNDAKYCLSSVRIPVFWCVESDMCMEVKKETTNYPVK